MSTSSSASSLFDNVSPESDFERPYRAVSRGAVIAFVLTLLSFGAFLSVVLLVLPLLAVIIGAFALRRIYRFPAELSGKYFALTSVIGSLAILVPATIMHASIYATEVPEGYQRISFEALNSRSDTTGNTVPPTALELNGKKIFIKGYVHPSVGGLGPVRRFVLVPDMGTCCFGGQPKLTDMIEVSVPEDKRIQYNLRKRRLFGTLRVDTRLKAVDGLTGVYYQLDAVQVQ